MDKNFYKAFEDQFRGSRDSVTRKLKVYDQFLELMAKTYPNSNVLDLGCGRGEWLELVATYGFNVKGIDLDDGMLESAISFGLNVQKADAIEYLKEQPDNSQSIISGFHIAEHLLIDTLLELITEAHRVLILGGFLILETPNPENIKVATSSFYLDPTHIRPIPSQLLVFLTQHYGFERTQVLRLQESQELLNVKSITLLQVISGVSPDYAVIAQKQAPNESALAFDELFSREYGLSLETLTDKFEHRLLKIEEQVNEANARADEWETKVNEANIKADEWETKVNEANIKADEWETKVNEANIKADEWETKVNEANIKADEWETKANEANIKADEWETKANESNTRADELEIKANEAFNAYTSIISSKSWKLTKPLRLIIGFVRWFMVGVMAWLTFSPVSRPMRIIKKLRQKNDIETAELIKMTQPYEIQSLSPRTQRIHAALTIAIQNNQKEKVCE